ncbi:MAG: type III effector HrpK domain-containing protein, partial [Janthinobacterium lividum]
MTTAACASAGATSSATGDPADSSIDDSSCKSSSDDLKKLAPLVQGLPPAQQEAAEKAMDRPLVAARMLKDGSPAEKKAAQAYFDANPTLKTALDTAAHGGKADGNISSHDISAFIGKMSEQQNRAVNTVTQYQKDYPNADGQSLQLVRQSALLQAYMPVLQGNSPDKDGKTGKYMTQDGLRAVLGDTGLPSVLRGAANTFSQPGMFEMLDQGGLDGHALATHNADGNVSEQNIIDWVSKQAPTTGGQFASTISDAATRGAVANVDTSQLNGDVFQNPQDYTGAQKAAVLVQLQDKQQQLQAGSDLKNNDKTNDAIQKDISQLSNDPDVQNYLAQAVP